ncbi:ferrichrome ABC transporter substrate-binding protein (plasmid) [Rhizobium etli 8C-3]|uniref:Ferrichrome ABC transporter substrate-binding protein n=1 Tax=Rhizobium etli 8C-3 TaxID=538025 RepID=A0A1L5PET7_RHIET|nr:ABC transporter substrate-binding protein [Rhizobium etli]APO78707.1 ferrichrome ABC transporter substrate-binding protein [Rhizobium etli 8C-3]
MAHFTRRHFMALTAALATPALVRAGEARRVATLDWALLETLLAIGANVVAAPELRQFGHIVVKPEVPASVADLGLRGTPNFEVLRFARPDLIFSSNFYAWADARMRLIAPVENHAVYKPREDPYDLAQQTTLSIGERLELGAARQLTEELAGKLQRFRAVFAKGDGRPVIPINLGDARHYRVFGSDSMFGAVLKRTGLTNAWQGATSYSAVAPVGIETLASMPDAWIVVIPPHPKDALATLEMSAFWNALPAVSEKRVIILGSINPYGALPAAMRFADLLAEALSSAWNG